MSDASNQLSVPSSDWRPRFDENLSQIQPPKDCSSRLKRWALSRLLTFQKLTFLNFQSVKDKLGQTHRNANCFCLLRPVHLNRIQLRHAEDVHRWVRNKPNPQDAGLDVWTPENVWLMSIELWCDIIQRNNKSNAVNRIENIANDCEFNLLQGRR